TKTNNTRKLTVGTTKKSVETGLLTLLLRKVSQVWEGGFRWRAIYLATVAWDTSIPSLSSSPWMRGAPQSGFARLIFRMRSRTSRDISGLPGLSCRLFQAQNRRNPRRCQAMTVSGLTMMSAERQPDHRCSSHVHNRRSTLVSRTRPRCALRSTLIWWRRARISNCRAARVWKQERRVPRKEKNKVNMGAGSLAAGANQDQRFQSSRLRK